MCVKNQAIKRIGSYIIKIIKFKSAARFRRANCAVWIKRVANRDLEYLMIHIKPEDSFLENPLSFTEAILLVFFNSDQFNRRLNKHQRISDFLFPFPGTMSKCALMETQLPCDKLPRGNHTIGKFTCGGKCLADLQ